jgi:hypothetical protein
MPDWYPLAGYSRELSAEGWLEAIGKRLVLGMYVYSVIEDGDTDEAERKFQSIVVERDNNPIGGLLEANPRFPVDELQVFEAFYLSALWGPEEYVDLRDLAARFADNPRETLTNAPTDYWKIENLGGDVLRHFDDKDAGAAQGQLLHLRVPIAVDISLDDETLVECFQIWLTTIRKSLGKETPKPIWDKDFARWKKYGVLSAFDLLLWEKIKNYRYTDAYLGHALWLEQNPDSDFVDTSERYRKTTKPLMKRVINWNTYHRLAGQTSLLEFIKRRLDEREKTEEKSD